MSYEAKIKSREDFRESIREEQEQGKKVVQCHGCFDIIHPGHIRYLEQAKKFGDILVVSLTADKFILKGDDRPYMPQELRVRSMAALEIVDYVYLDNESWAGPILEFSQPDIYVKGKEYEQVFTGSFGDERGIVEKYGGKVFFTSGDVVFSSSQLIEDFKKKFALEYEVFKIFCQRNDIHLAGLKNLIKDFSNKKIAVIGEAIVDEYIFSDVLNASGEAPILTVRPLKSETYVGAAGIVARHIKSLGGQSSIYTILGNDRDAEEVQKCLDKEGVKLHAIRSNKYGTIKKTRFLADNQKLLKVDYSKTIYLEKEQEDEIIEKVKANEKDADCIVFSDFAYGFITDRIRKEIITWANENDIKVIADVSSTLGGNISKYKDVFLITPTEKEARMFFDDKEGGLSVIAHNLLKLTGSKNIIITLGANGLLAFKNKKFQVHGDEHEHLENEYIPALEKKALDPVGAGDAMLSMISLSLSAGASLSEAVYLGNIASYLEVNLLGNIPIRQEKVLEFLHERPELA